MSDTGFRYTPQCSMNGCANPAAYKVAAAWAEGPRRELKNYGCACETHRQEMLDRARANRANLKTLEGETVGTPMLYHLEPGRHDSQLRPV